MRTEIVGGNRIEFFFNKEWNQDLKTEFTDFEFFTNVTPGARGCIVGTPYFVAEKILSVLRNRASVRPLSCAQNIRVNGHKLIFWDDAQDFWLMTEDEYCMEDDLILCFAIYNDDNRRLVFQNPAYL